MEKPSMALLVIAGPTVSRNCNMSLDPLRCISDGDGNSTMLYLPLATNPLMIVISEKGVCMCKMHSGTMLCILAW